MLQTLRGCFNDLRSGFHFCENNELCMNLHATCLNLDDMTSDIVGAQVAMDDVF